MLGHRAGTDADIDRDDADPISDDELTALALAADPDAAPGPDAVSLWSLDQPMAPGGLPDWYMPAPAAARPDRGWRRVVVLVIIAAFIAIAASGLCSTYGEIVIA